MRPCGARLRLAGHQDLIPADRRADIQAPRECTRPPLARIDTRLTRWPWTEENGRDAEAGKERLPMTEQNQARNLLATLRDALHKLEFQLGRTRDGVAEIANQAERLRESVEALCELRQREDTSVGIEMFVDAAVDLREAFRELEAGILDVQADVATLAAEIVDDEQGRDA
jgi:hypothetical protein